MSQPNANPLPDRHQPETLRLRTLTPGLTVADLDVALAWYCDVVGFVVVEKWEKDGEIAGAVLEAGRVRVFLVQGDGTTTSGATLQFYCATAQNIDELAAAIQARGGVLDAEPADQPWGARTFDLIDPDGVRLTVSSINTE